MYTQQDYDHALAFYSNLSIADLEGRIERAKARLARNYQKFSISKTQSPEDMELGEHYAMDLDLLQIAYFRVNQCANFPIDEVLQEMIA